MLDVLRDAIVKFEPMVMKADLWFVYLTRRMFKSRKRETILAAVLTDVQMKNRVVAQLTKLPTSIRVQAHRLEKMPYGTWLATWRGSNN